MYQIQIKVSSEKNYLCITFVSFLGYAGIPCRVAGLIPKGHNSGGLNIDNFVEPSKQRAMSEGSMYALAAASQALTDANWKPFEEKDRIRTGRNLGR